jgi:NAD(P)-dependent dehydrogenase (short-subunit alcohol dehydrogenase family)
MEVDGKVIVVTGATSGIGRATAEVLASHGASVMVAGRNAGAAAEVVAAITDAGGVAGASLGDVADPAFAERLIVSTVVEYGRVDAVVNAAGVIVRAGATETSDEDFAWVMKVNVTGTFNVSRAAVRAMRETGGGAIVNVSSTCGLVGTKGMVAYCASKGAVTLMTQAMALDHASEGIRVNAVCPGAVDTPMLRSGRDADPLSDDAILASNLASIPQGRVPDASEVAELIAFLVSDASAHIVGAAIPIDGGYVAQ